MKLTRRKIRQIILESLLLENRRTRDWIQKTQPESDQDALLQVYNDGIRDISQLSWIQKTRGTEPIPDVAADVLRFFDPQVQKIVKENGFPTDLNKRNYPTVNELRRVISQVEALIDSRKEKPTPAIEPINDPEQVEKLAQVGPWSVLLPKTVMGSIACDRTGDETTWCTTKKRGQNLFLSYVGRERDDIILFYVMDYSRTPDDAHEYRDKACMANNDSRLSIGFHHGVPVLDGQSGGLSVDASNKGLTANDLKSDNCLGEHYDKIMSILKAEAAVIGSNHPAKEAMRRAAKDILYLKTIIKDYGEEEKRDYVKQVANSSYPKSTEVKEFTAFYEPRLLLNYIRTDPYREGESLTPQFVKKLFEIIMTSTDIKKLFKYQNAHFDYNKATFMEALLLHKSHLMDDELFQMFLEEYTFLKTRYKDEGMQKRTFNDLLDKIINMQSYIAKPHPRFAQAMANRERETLSEKGMEKAIREASYTRAAYGGLTAVSDTYFTSKNTELKTQFFIENVESKFNYVLSIVRFLLENGNNRNARTGETRPQVIQTDGLAFGMTIKILEKLVADHQTYSPTSFSQLSVDHPKAVIQEIENAIFENFPEFFQMSKSEFTDFMKKGKYDVDDQFYNYSYNMSIKRFCFTLFDGPFSNNAAQGKDPNASIFGNLFSAIAASEHISPRAANHFKKHVKDYPYFLDNTVHCDDQFLVDMFKSLPDEFRYVERYRADGSTEKVRRRKPDLKLFIDNQIQRRFFGIRTWTLGPEILKELGIKDRGM